MTCLFSHPFVADLAWLVEGHYIEQDFDLEPYWVDDIEARLMALDRHPESLVEAINACKSHFLGSYFESLFSFAIAHLSTLTPVLEHFQIENEGRTLGEVDILVETPEGELHQFEIAIKFYLERPDLAPHNWIGPNKNDSLLKKVTRAREHQLLILKTPEGQKSIREKVGDRAIQSHLLIFGRLYEALEKPLFAGDSDVLAALLADDERGGWLRASEWTLLMRHFSEFLVLDKPHWLANPNESDNFTFFSLESAYNLVGEFLQDERPKHVLLRNEGEHKGKNIFVVPDSW